MEETPLVSLSLTHVHYNPEDPLSFLSAWLALVPQALCVAYVTLIWASREVEVGLMFAGQLGCEALNFVLKRIIKEERPKQMFGKGYGMPSSHAQFVAFFAVYLSLFLLVRHVPNPDSTSYFLMRVVLAIGLCLGASAVAVSRIYLNYHTPRQVLAGCAAGVFCAVSWYLVTGVLRANGYIEWALDLGVSRLARLRDLVVSQDLTEAGWQQWEAQRKLKRPGHSKRRPPKSD
ncbi:phosphatase PAP2 family protein [Aspergillus clavatus NRRL 1]|uniref:Dolichyldiphosphatase n=1 Tax=Aspergillus clavatus (strain ATCC 1007 / CBS 513.65 / DSM 816 / NCTC 3887 / NRRL 1 / QM 1276 / 107) TaxID=344612 RepID=A1CMD6_ASPCL|nr:PAP2 domain protein [Aspergillus clavatus NRRL 1]EAW08723.1 PAP2 domain protein [Aspergillus clavatus NRRL 1]